MRTAVGASSPDSRPGTRLRTRRNVEAELGSPTPRSGREGNRKCPPSILRLKQPERCRGCREEPPRTSRHVRFREPLEVAVHYIASREHTPTIQAVPQPPPRGRSLLRQLLVCTLFGLMLGLLLGLCCGQTKPLAPALEDLRAWLLFLALRLWHAAVTCWHSLLQL